MQNSSPIYLTSLTEDARKAYYVRDKDALAAQIKALAAQIGSASDVDFYPLAAKLMVTTALYDSLRGGPATMFISDYINF